MGGGLPSTIRRIEVALLFLLSQSVVLLPVWLTKGGGRFGESKGIEVQVSKLIERSPFAKCVYFDS